MGSRLAVRIVAVALLVQGTGCLAAQVAGVYYATVLVWVTASAVVGPRHSGTFTAKPPDVRAEAAAVAEALAERFNHPIERVTDDPVTWSATFTVGQGRDCTTVIIDAYAGAVRVTLRRRAREEDEALRAARRVVQEVLDSRGLTWRYRATTWNSETPRLL